LEEGGIPRGRRGKRFRKENDKNTDPRGQLTKKKKFTFCI